MGWVWAIPGGLALIGATLLATVAHRAATEAAGLRRTLLAFRELQPELDGVREVAGQSVSALAEIRNTHRPPLR